LFFKSSYSKSNTCSVCKPVRDAIHKHERDMYKKQKMAAQQARLHFNPNTPPSSLMLCFTKDEILEHLTVRLKNV